MREPAVRKIARKPASKLVPLIIRECLPRVDEGQVEHEGSNERGSYPYAHGHEEAQHDADNGCREQHGIAGVEPEQGRQAPIRRRSPSLPRGGKILPERQDAVMPHQS